MGLQTQARLTSQLTPVNGRTRYPDAADSINFFFRLLWERSHLPFFGKWGTSLNNSWSGKTENPTVHSSLPLYLSWRNLWAKPFDTFLGVIPRQTGQLTTAPRLPLGHSCQLGTSCHRAQPSFPLPACLRSLPDTRQRAEAQQANDSQMLLNSCKNTVHKWTTWHLGLLVFLPVKKSPQESTLSTFTDRNALWKIIHKHKRLAIQCRAVFPHNFI